MVVVVMITYFIMPTSVPAIVVTVVVVTVVVVPVAAL